jgi:hypothetical protein
VVEGAYLGVRIINEDKYPEIVKRGYLFDINNNRKFDSMFRFTTEVVEMMFMNDEGSVVSYKENGQFVEPVLADSEYKEKEKRYIGMLQKGTIVFLQLFRQEVLFNNIKLLPHEVVQGYINYAVHPSLATINRYSDFSFFDGSKKKMVPDRNVLYYIIHPKDFLLDLSNCNTIFMLKKLFKIPLPYFEIVYWGTGVLNVKSGYRRRVKN